MHEGGQALRWRPRGRLESDEGEEEVLKSQNGSDFAAIHEFMIAGEGLKQKLCNPLSGNRRVSQISSDGQLASGS